jgi:hypothetical protein
MGEALRVTWQFMVPPKSNFQLVTAAACDGKAARPISEGRNPANPENPVNPVFSVNSTRSRKRQDFQDWQDEQDCSPARPNRPAITFGRCSKK